MYVHFFDDFERTEYSDFIHAVIGRSLIIATRFDCSCNGLAIAIEYKTRFIEAKITDDFDNFINKIFSKYRPINNSINSFTLPDDIHTTLHSARKARNKIAHSLCKDLDGCADLKTDENQFIEEVSKLIKDITYGDIIISCLIHEFNNDSNSIYIDDKYIQKYQDNILNWVIKE